MRFSYFGEAPVDVIKRLVKAIHIQYVFFAVTVVALGYALTTPTIVDPFIAFVLAGVVPGTDIVLAPETVLLILADLFGLALAAALISMLVRRRLLGDGEYVALAQPQPEPAQPEPEVAAKASRPSRPTLWTRLGRTLPAYGTRYPLLGVIISAVSILRWLAVAAILTAVQWVKVAGGWLGRLGIFMLGMTIIIIRFVASLMIEGCVQLCRAIAKGLALALRYGTWGVVFFIVALGMVIDWSLRGQKHLWRFIKPYLRQFDGWLEIRYRALSGRVAQSYRSYELMQVIATVAKDGVRTVRQLFKP